MSIKELDIIGDNNTCAVIILARDSVFFAGLRHYEEKGGWKTVSLWTVPGGRCEAGERLEVTLRREVSEEVGVTDFEVSHFLGTFAGAKEGDLVYLFGGKACGEPYNNEPTKFSDWRWMQLEEIPPNFISPAAIPLMRTFLSGADA